MTHNMIEIFAGLIIATIFWLLGQHQGRNEKFEVEIPGLKMTKRGNDVIFKIDRAALEEGEHERIQNI